MEFELRECPFCGSEAERKENRRYRKGYRATVGCKNQLCPARITQAALDGTAEDAYKRAANAWNERANKTAHWMWSGDDDHLTGRCSSCGEKYFIGMNVKHDYCNGCGAKMVAERK